METYEISQLANVLRGYGDKVLNSESKLTLSTNLLNNLNNAFNLVAEERSSLTASFQVVNNSNAKIEILSDLQFLYDFVQRSTSLKLIPSDSGTPCDAVDISMFKNLKLLELQKVKINAVTGLQCIRPHLQFLICTRSLNTLNQVLEISEPNSSAVQSWNDLKEAAFTHNNLHALDNSLHCAPWIHTLDLSHNNLKSVEAVNGLLHLKHLNLSYNKLECVPEFSGQICSRLQVLILKNNFVEDIRNVMVLVNLCELDMSDNCLLEHNVLSPISHLAALKWLNVEGNPLSYNPQHRAHTAIFLHKNTVTVKFLLDRILLNKSEQKLVGTAQSVRNTIQSQPQLTADIPVAEDMLANVERPRRVRNATITDASIEARLSPVSCPSLTTSMEHLETKRQIEELRTKFGSQWLQQDAGSMVQDMLGLERTPLPVTSSPYERDFLLHAKITPTPVNGKDKAEVTSEQSNNTFVTAPESVLSDSSVYAGNTADDENSSDEDVDLGDGDESMYFAKKRGETEELLLMITKNRITERECISSKELAHWHIHSLKKCELINSDLGEYVKLDFDTLRRDRMQREYVLDRDEVFRLVSVLQKIIQNRPPEKTTTVVYQCMKCSVKFKKNDKKFVSEDQLQCPSCESTLVIEDDR